MNDFPHDFENMDIEAFVNIRAWLEKALESAGAQITDAGIGGGQVDVGITVLGMPYSLSIKPRKLKE